MTNTIRNIAIITTAALAVGTTIAANLPVQDDGLSPLQAHTVNMEDYTAVVYYTQNDNDSFQVITTVGPNIDIDGQITRHQTVVRPGDNYVFSLDNGVAGSAATKIDFSSENGKLIVVSQ